MTRKVNPKSLENLKKGKPFVKGDPRINPGGKIKNFDELRVFLQEIAHEEVIDERNKKILRLREIVLNLSEKDYLEFAYGKVPLSQLVDITSGGKPINWKSFINGSDSDTNSETNSK
jgi:hypothetical protein